VVSSPETYRRHRFPIEVVEHCVWLYFRFALSYRNVEEMMAKRGVQLTYETVRTWCHKFGTLYAARLRRKRPTFGSKWHLDEVLIRINGIQHYLWRAVAPARRHHRHPGTAEAGSLGRAPLLQQAAAHGRM
jgi:putative transposase